MANLIIQRKVTGKNPNGSNFFGIQYLYSYVDGKPKWSFQKSSAIVLSNKVGKIVIARLADKTAELIPAETVSEII